MLGWAAGPWSSDTGFGSGKCAAATAGPVVDGRAVGHDQGRSMMCGEVDDLCGGDHGSNRRGEVTVEMGNAVKATTTKHVFMLGS